LIDVTSARLTLWICNGNRNLQHAVADRQSNFQACSFNHSDISPFRINDLRAIQDKSIAKRSSDPAVLRWYLVSAVYGQRQRRHRVNCVIPLNVVPSLTGVPTFHSRCTLSEVCPERSFLSNRSSRRLAPDPSPPIAKLPVNRPGAAPPRPRACSSSRARISKPSRSEHSKKSCPINPKLESPPQYASGRLREA